ncbi:hypothetical protein LDENG_00201460 [Lucifuga dentata]|nr:hypothetical protein LDENG_00201460 [Lucifuga dentata]
MQVNPFSIKWFYSFLTNRSQQVRIKCSLSEVRCSSTGVLQVCMSSTVLFTLYIDDHRSRQLNNYTVKFSDDTIILSLLSSADSPLAYYKITDFVNWYDHHHLILNVSKTDDMIADPREVGDHEPVIIRDSTIMQVCSYEYLGYILTVN